MGLGGLAVAVPSLYARIGNKIRSEQGAILPRRAIMLHIQISAVLPWATWEGPRSSFWFDSLIGPVGGAGCEESYISTPEHLLKLIFPFTRPPELQLLCRPFRSSPKEYVLLNNQAINPRRVFGMKFLITAIIACFALANLGFAAPIAGPAMLDYLVQLSSNNELASAHGGLWRRYHIF